MNFSIFGSTIYEIVWWFWIYSFLGWAFESIYSSIHEGRLLNRGYITGPFCTIYGVGAITIILLLSSFKNNIILLFIASIVVTSALEYVVYIIMDKLFSQKWWDYSDLKFNFKGILSLESSIAWGVLAVILMKILHPLISMFINIFSISVGIKILMVVTVIYLVDFIHTTVNTIKKSESPKVVILRVKTETLRRIIVGIFRRN